MSVAFNVAALAVVGGFLAVAVLAVRAGIRTRRERRADRARIKTGDALAREAARLRAQHDARQNYNRSVRERHLESVDAWLARTGGQPTRKDRA